MGQVTALQTGTGDYSKLRLHYQKKDIYTVTMQNKALTICKCY